MLWTSPLLQKEEDLHIRLIINGLNAPKIKKIFLENSSLKKLNSTIDSREKSKLLNAIEEDKALLEETLNAFFFFDHKVLINNQKRQNNLYTIEFSINKGIRYVLESFDIVLTKDMLDLKPSPEQLPLKLNQPANYMILNMAQDSLLTFYNDSGYPFAALEQIQLDIDRENKTVKAIQKVNSEGKFQFGPSSVTGLKAIPESLVKKYLFWKEGQDFSLSKVKETKAVLENSLWFSAVHINYPMERDLSSSSILPISIDLQERQHRELALGLKYNTQEQVGMLMECEHRNLLDKGYHLKFLLNASRIKKNVNLQLTHPNRWNKNNTFGLQTGFSTEKVSNGISNKQLFFQPFIKHKANERLRYHLGMSLEASEDNSQGSKKNFALLSLPLKLHWTNKKPHPLNVGRTFKISLSPFFKINKNSHYFFSSFLTLNQSFLLSEKSSFSFWSDLGAIHGASLKKIPAQHRLFGGSGRFFRGYAYHSLPYNLNEDRSLGGRSLYSLGIEYRRQVYRDWHANIFFESGKVFSNKFPVFKEKPLKSAGLGLSYFLGKLPMKLEIAFPLDRRQRSNKKMIDKRKCQVYIQLGENF
jgi:translocation and assembly module TamA